MSRDTLVFTSSAPARVLDRMLAMRRQRAGGAPLDELIRVTERNPRNIRCIATPRSLESQSVLALDAPARRRRRPRGRRAHHARSLVRALRTRIQGAAASFGSGCCGWLAGRGVRLS